MWQQFTIGITLGLFSSLHCVGMCGPLALSLPVYNLSKPKRLIAVANYNMGRVISYSFLGLLVGLLNTVVVFAGIQQWFSIAAGAGLLIFTGIGFFTGRKHAAPFNGWLQNRIGSLLKRSDQLSFLALGMANGLLPCGMVYLAIAAAVGSGSMPGGLLTMFAFGLGTVPAMVILSELGYRIGIKGRIGIRKMMPLMAVIVGSLLLIRGLNLNIPYLSPLLISDKKELVPCTH
jgi:sulfite exporter TauE/SafE